MSVATLKYSIHQLVDTVQDEHLLQSFNSLLENVVRMQAQMLVGYDADFQPITESQLAQEVTERVQNVKQGLFMTHQEMLDSIKNKFN
jgi:hypothetical protein